MLWNHFGSDHMGTLPLAGCGDYWQELQSLGLRFSGAGCCGLNHCNHFTSIQIHPFSRTSNHQLKTTLYSNEFRIMATQEFPGGLAVRILGFNCHGPSSIPYGQTEILQVMKQSKKKKEESRLHIPRLRTEFKPLSMPGLINTKPMH